jgi:hypothetical protein
MLHVDWTHVLTMPWGIPVIFGCLVGMVSIVAKRVSQCVTQMAEINLKRAMVERGFPAAEIERVVRATREPVDGAPVPGKPGLGQ